MKRTNIIYRRSSDFNAFVSTYRLSKTIFLCNLTRKFSVAFEHTATLPHEELCLRKKKGE